MWRIITLRDFNSEKLAPIIYVIGVIVMIVLMIHNQPVYDNDQSQFIPTIEQEQIDYVPENFEDPAELTIIYDHEQYNLMVIDRYVRKHQTSILHSTVTRSAAIYEIKDEHQLSSYGKVKDWANALCYELYMDWQENDPEMSVRLMVQSATNPELIIYCSLNGETD